jgi:hypothetical protein
MGSYITFKYIDRISYNEVNSVMHIIGCNHMLNKRMYYKITNFFVILPNLLLTILIQWQ